MSEIVYAVTAILFLLFLLLGAGMTLKGNWFRAWLRGTIVLSSLGCAVFLLLFTFELSRLDAFDKDGPVGYVALKNKNDTNIDFQWTSLDRKVNSFSLTNTDWMVDIRILSFGSSQNAATGYFSPGKLTSGSLSFNMAEPSLFFDIFEFFNVLKNHLPFIQVHTYTSPVTPFIDLAQFTIIKRNERLIVWPSNHHAAKAVPKPALN